MYNTPPPLLPVTFDYTLTKENKICESKRMNEPNGCGSVDKSDVAT